MLDTSSWPREQVKVADLQLDPKNVRLEIASAVVEADIIEDLFDNEGAYDLAESMVKLGYLTHEIPVAVKRKGRHVVVEGNRRLAALKALQNPMIVPSHQARVAALVEELGSTRLAALKTIEVMVAPNQTAADELIAALHTSNPRRPWSPARQAAFFQAQIDAKRTYKQLLARYPTIDVPDFVLRARLVNRLKAGVKSEPDLADFIGSKSWKTSFSALTRIFESKDFREISGVQLDNSGDLRLAVTDDQFDAIARLIVEGIWDQSINTRTINKIDSPRFTKLIADMRSAVGLEGDHGGQGGGAQSGNSSTSGKAGGKSSDDGSSEGTASPGAKPPPKRAKKPPARKKTTVLSIGHISAPDTYPPAVRLHLEELSVLKIQWTPFSAFLLLRATLEKSIKSFAEAKGVDIGTTKHSNQGRVQLHNCINWLHEWVSTHGPQDLKQPVAKLLSGKLLYYTTTKDSLNAVNHNHKFVVDGDDVVAMWNSIDPIMRVLMKP